jgi:hypothetical protein
MYVQYGFLYVETVQAQINSVPAWWWPCSVLKKTTFLALTSNTCRWRRCSLTSCCLGGWGPPGACWPNVSCSCLPGQEKVLYTWPKEVACSVCYSSGITLQMEPISLMWCILIATVCYTLLYKNLFPKIILPHMYLTTIHLFYFLTANCTFERLALLYLAILGYTILYCTSTIPVGIHK